MGKKKKTKGAGGPPRPDLRVAHLLPVVAATREAGWLLLTGKRDGPLAAGLDAAVPAEHCSWEAPVRSWFVGHAHLRAAVAAVRAAGEASGGVAFCVACAAGQPCARWSTVPRCEYEIRDPRRAVEDAVGADADDAAAGAPSQASPEEARRAALERSWRSQVAASARTLGLEFPCSAEALRARYRDAARAAHPDRGGSHEAMSRINQARDVLARALAEADASPDPAG